MRVGFIVVVLAANFDARDAMPEQFRKIDLDVRAANRDVGNAVEAINIVLFASELSDAALGLQVVGVDAEI